MTSGGATPLPDRILVVDDTEANVRLLERMLALDGYQNVKATTDPRDTLDLVDSFKPDLILLDLNMPHLDGFMILAAVKDHCGLSAPLMIVLTGDVSPLTHRRALKNGATLVITKPFDRKELLACIRSLLPSAFEPVNVVAAS
jgi:putative two-component system response regulator